MPMQASKQAKNASGISVVANHAFPPLALSHCRLFMNADEAVKAMGAIPGLKRSAVEVDLCPVDAAA